MVRTLLVRGMPFGFIAGLLVFGFAKVFGEPRVDRAIAFGTAMNDARIKVDAARASTTSPSPNWSAGGYRRAGDC